RIHNLGYEVCEISHPASPESPFAGFPCGNDLAAGAPLPNISSIRSVTTEPPTMLSVARSTGTRPHAPHHRHRDLALPVGMTGDQNRAAKNHPVDPVRSRHQGRMQGCGDLG